MMAALSKPDPIPPPKHRADYFNRECQCVSLDKTALRRELLKQPDGQDLLRMLLDERPHLFAESVVFVDEHCIRRQADIIAAIEKVVAMPSYQEKVLTYAPATARFVPRARGVFLSYDFHLGAETSQLIEINTNAGGPMLNVLLARAQKGCGDWTAAGGCEAGHPPVPETFEPEQMFMDMFREEWQAERGHAPLHSIAIVDERPEDQFLFPEFLLFQRLFERSGYEAAICDPGGLALRDGRLWRGNTRIDLVYNRLTDFALEKPQHACLRDAYLSGAAVVTPHPRAHALYADKRNLALLTDESCLTGMGVDAATRSLLLSGIAHTRCVKGQDEADLWNRRRRLFFKPAAGYGGKAAYRGDKLTRRVFDEILHGDYVIQELVPPSERMINVAGGSVSLKLDLRHFVYRGAIQLTTTRLYQGQTTNFRTPGGGFAPTVMVPAA